MARRFMFVCLGILALAVAYHLGAATAESQVGSPFTCIYVDPVCTNMMMALTEDGTIYWAYTCPNTQTFPDWHYWGQIPNGGTTTEPTTWGQIKAQFKD